MSVENRLSSIETFLRDSETSRNVRHTQVCERLSRIETKQDDFPAYQAECDKERNDLSGRVVNLESFRKSIVFLATTISAVGAFAINGAMEWMKK